MGPLNISVDNHKPDFSECDQGNEWCNRRGDVLLSTVVTCNKQDVAVTINSSKQKKNDEI